MRVCIIGCGLSALTLAKALVNQNIFVDIISLNKNYNINKSRTIGISKSNYEYFNKNIININKVVWKINKIEIFTDNSKNEKILNFENNKDQLFSIVKNFDIYNILNKSLSTNKFCQKIKFKKNLKFNKYNLIINTDHRSYFTKKFFNKKISKSYDSSACTTIINHEKIKNNIAVQIFTKRGPLAFLPISNNKTSIVYSIKNLDDQDKENFEKIIHHYNFKYKIKAINKIEYFDLKSFNLRTYYHHNILAFGDLLHKIHPLAGQGFNMTIRDINTLINLIKSKIDLGLPLDSSINYQFEKKLKHKNILFSDGIDFIYEFFNFERKLNNNVLSKSVKLLGKNPSLKKMFTEIADRGVLKAY